MGVRKIPKNHRSVTGLVASSKNGGMSAFESTLERDLMIRLEFDLTIERFEEQPLIIKYYGADGLLRTYVPDILVRYRKDLERVRDLSPLLCEVKYRADLFANWKELKPKFKAARAYVKEVGWRFAIFTEYEIRTAYLNNAKFLLGYRNINVNYHQVRLLIDTLKELRVATPDELLLACFKDKWNRAELMPTLWYLLSTGQVGTDLHLPLTMNSEMWTLE